jgi:hypothetical protein
MRPHAKSVVSPDVVRNELLTKEFGHTRFIGLERTMDASTRRARTLAAAVMITGSAVVGFVAGRTSAWLVPVGAGQAPQRLSLSDDASKTHAPAAIPGTSASTGMPLGRADKPQAEPHGVGSERLSGTVSLAPAGTPDKQPAAATEPEPPRVILLNPESAAKQSDQIATPSEPVRPASNTDDIERCAKRFSSFRRSDGTYQPYGGRERERCPFLQ